MFGIVMQVFFFSLCVSVSTPLDFLTFAPAALPVVECTVNETDRESEEETVGREKVSDWNGFWKERDPSVGQLQNEITQWHQILLGYVRWCFLLQHI